VDLPELFAERGFSRVFVLDGAACGIPEPALILAAMPYAAEAVPAAEDAWIHPYYPVSQRAYRAARELAEMVPGLALRPDIRVKPIFARLGELTQGRNTLSYLPETGSRFHVQIFTLDRSLPPNAALLPAPKPLHCGSCRRCMEVCPAGAITEEGFVRERCLRFWQLSGKPAPEALRPLMGNRLIGCDDCQRCCPHNTAPRADAAPAFPLERLLASPGEAAADLAGQIGANLALPNRLLTQACLIAANTARTDLLPCLARLREHPSAAVAESAAWAVEALRRGMGPEEG